MTRVGVFWTAYGHLTFRTSTNLSKTLDFSRLFLPKEAFQIILDSSDVDYKIPPIPPLPKGGLSPQYQEGIKGRIPTFLYSGGFAGAKSKRGNGRFFNNDALRLHALIIVFSSSYPTIKKIIII